MINIVIASTAKLPVKFTQADTEDLALEMKEVRRLKYPIDKTERLKSINALRAFAIEWEVKFTDIDPANYFQSIVIFDGIKGLVMRSMRKELTKLSTRDSETMRKVLGGGMDFGAMEEPEV